MSNPSVGHLNPICWGSIFNPSKSALAHFRSCINFMYLTFKSTANLSNLRNSPLKRAIIQNLLLSVGLWYRQVISRDYNLKMVFT
jgi:hypothetical protein